MRFPSKLSIKKFYQHKLWLSKSGFCIRLKENSKIENHKIAIEIEEFYLTDLKPRCYIKSHTPPIISTPSSSPISSFPPSSSSSSPLASFPFSPSLSLSY